MLRRNLIQGMLTSLLLFCKPKGEKDPSRHKTEVEKAVNQLKQAKYKNIRTIKRGKYISVIIGEK